MAKLIKRKNGVFYIQENRSKKFSLKTRDKQLAEKTFELMQSELAIVDVYREILIRYDKVLSEIREHHKSIANLLKTPAPSGERPFVTEKGLENFVIENLAELDIKLLGRQVRIGHGIVDIMGESSGKKIALEIKLGTLSEIYLGQCLRYLRSHDICEIYLIGEDVDKSIQGFKGFNIQIFTVKKYLRKGRNVFIRHKIK